MVATSTAKLKGEPLEVVQDTVAAALYPSQPITLKESSGRSGARAFLVSNEDRVLALIKVQGDSGLNSHLNTQQRMKAATEALRDHGIAPSVLMIGPDFYVEASAGTSVMKDFFHFDHDKAPCEDLAQLLARVHAAPIDWWTPLKEAYIARDPAIAGILGKAPPYAPVWNLPFSGIDTGKLVMGMGNIPDATTEAVLRLQIETGVFEKVMCCDAFSPQTEAGRRQVVTHGDFKPDNVLCTDDGTLSAIDYDLTQVGPAVTDFGYMLPMWFGKMSFDFRRNFTRHYLEAAGLACGEQDVHAFMLDCEVASLTSLPGLLANIYDKEIPLLRGVPHPTAKDGHSAGSADDSPTGPEIVELLSEAVQKVRAEPALAARCVREGLVTTLFATEGVGLPQLGSWLQHMCTSNMLRLFGIAPPS